MPPLAKKKFGSMRVPRPPPGGFSTKVHGVLDALGNCVHLDLPPGQQADCLLVADVEQTAKKTIALINAMHHLMEQAREQLRGYSFYSQDLLHHLFRYPYTRTEFVEKELAVSRLTASKYLTQLAAPGGLLQKHKLGRANYYVNQPLFELLAQLGWGRGAPSTSPS